MAWRIKLCGTSLVVLEYLIEQPLQDPLILNSAGQPLLALTVGGGCSNDDRDSFISKDIKDPLKLFKSDKKTFPSRSRSLSVNDSDLLNEMIEIETTATASTESFTTSSSVYQQEDDSELEQGEGRCAQTKLWLNQHLAMEGYHVLCVTKPPHLDSLKHPHNPGISFEVQAWEDGYMNLPNNQTYHAATFAEFRRQLEEIFTIDRTDAWRVKSTEAIRQGGLKADGNSKWAFLPQKWRLFDVHRQAVETLPAVQDQQLLLLFEGGQFIFPGVDMNFEREVIAQGSTYLFKTLSLRPLLFQVDNLLEDEECAYMIDYSAPLMAPSDVSLMDRDEGKPATDFRTSQYVFMNTRSHSVLRRIDERIADLTGLDIRNQEDAQILKYEVGNYYLSHNDYWSPSFYQSRDMIQMTQAGHKNRMATVFWYMNSDVEGGCTSFTHAPVHDAFASQTVPVAIRSSSSCSSSSCSSSMAVENPPSGTSSDPLIKDMIDCEYGLKVAPKKGRAIIFYSLLANGEGDDYSEHAACAVTKGTKWAANKWIWNQVR